MNRSSGTEHEGVGRDMEEALREFGPKVMPVDHPEIALARRDRTVAHLRALQARAVVRSQDARLWRRRFLVAALVFFPTGALAATWAVLRETSDHGVAPVAEGKGTAPRSAHAGRATPPVSGSNSEASALALSSSETADDSVVQPSPAAAMRESASEVSSAFAAPTRRTLPSPAPTPPSRRAAESASPGPSAGHGADRVSASFKSFPDGAAQTTETSTLAAENALMQSAMSAARAGDDSRAILRFSDFLARYPRSPLAENASVERLRALARLRAAPAPSPSGAASSDVPRQ